MKILYVIGGLGLGGAEQQLLYLVEGMARLADVTVVSLSESSTTLKPNFERMAGVRVVLCPKRPGIDVTLIPRLVTLCRREQPTIVHTYLRTANYWGRLAGYLARTPVLIVSERNIELERGKYANLLDKVLASVTDRVVVNAVAIRDFLVKAEGLNPAKIEVIPNGVPTFPDFSRSDVRIVRQEWGLGAEDHIVAFVGRLVPQKNPKLFLEMAQSVLRIGFKCGFLIIGEGPLLAHLIAEVRRLGIGDAVRFTGFRLDITRILAAIDLLVLTSEWEGLPNVVLEALAVGVPVVATDAGGIRELLVDGVVGHVVPRRDLSALVDRVIGMLSDQSFRAECGRRGREYVQVQFSISQMVDRTVALYNTVLRSRGLPELRSA